MKAVQVGNVTKRFGELAALKDIELSVEEGEFFGLFGPNGAGKTTLMRILTGQIAPSKGKAKVLGTPTSDPINIKKKVGIVPEAETPPTFLTAKEFLQLVCRLRDIDDTGKRVSKWLRFFAIEEKADILCRDLSKGQRQKVMLAAALIHGPRLLLLDEPFINLDPIFQKKVRGHLAKLVGEGVTVFMCTHILEIAEKLCDRMAVINKGRIVAKGTIEEIRSRDDERLEDIFMRLVEEG